MQIPSNATESLPGEGEGFVDLILIQARHDCGLPLIYYG